MAIITFDRLASRWVISASRDKNQGSLLHCVRFPALHDLSFYGAHLVYLSIRAEHDLGSNSRGQVYWPSAEIIARRAMTQREANESKVIMPSPPRLPKQFGTLFSAGSVPILRSRPHLSHRSFVVSLVVSVNPLHVLLGAYRAVWINVEPGNAS